MTSLKNHTILHYVLNMFAADGQLLGNGTEMLRYNPFVITGITATFPQIDW